MNKFTTVFSLVFAVFLVSCVDTGKVEGPIEITNHVDDWRDEVIYQLITDRFADGDVNNNYNVNKKSLTSWNGGDFQGIIDNIDYLKKLGVTALWISPVVKNVDSDAGIAGYHGYWTQNFKAVNPHFGDLAKLREMIKVLHENDIKVILDIVANHVGQLFYYDMNKNDQPDEMVMGSDMTCDAYCGHITGVEDENVKNQICSQEYSRESISWRPEGNDCYANCVWRCKNEEYPQKMGIVRYSEWDPDFDPRKIRSFSDAGESGVAPIKWVYMPEINRVPPEPAEFHNDDWYNRMGRTVTWDSRYQVVKKLKDTSGKEDIHYGGYFYPGTYDTSEESLASNPNRIKVEYRVEPYNASHPEVTFEYDKTSLEGVIYLDPETNEIIFLKPRTVTFVLTSHDGSTVRKEIMITLT